MNAADDGLAGIQQLAGDATLLYYMTEEAQEGKQRVPREARARLRRSSRSARDRATDERATVTTPAAEWVAGRAAADARRGGRAGARRHRGRDRRRTACIWWRAARRARRRARAAGRRQLRQRLLRRRARHRRATARARCGSPRPGSRRRRRCATPRSLAFGVAAVVGLRAVARRRTRGCCSSASPRSPRPCSTPAARSRYGYIGLGEVMVLVFFGFVATVGSRVRAGRSACPAAAWWGALAVGLLACAILLANNVRDVDDRRASRQAHARGAVGARRGAPPVRRVHRRARSSRSSRSASRNRGRCSACSRCRSRVAPVRLVLHARPIRRRSSRALVGDVAARGGASPCSLARRAVPRRDASTGCGSATARSRSSRDRRVGRVLAARRAIRAIPPRAARPPRRPRATASPPPVRAAVPVNALVDGPPRRCRRRSRAVPVREGQGRSPVAGDDVALVARGARRVGPASRSGSTPTARGTSTPRSRMIARLARFDLELVEQPVATLDDLAGVRRRVDVPVAADECVRSLDDARRLRALDAADVDRAQGPAARRRARRARGRRRGRRSGDRDVDDGDVGRHRRRARARRRAARAAVRVRARPRSTTLPGDVVARPAGARSTACCAVPDAGRCPIPTCSRATRGRATRERTRRARRASASGCSRWHSVARRRDHDDARTVGSRAGHLGRDRRRTCVSRAPATSSDRHRELAEPVPHRRLRALPERARAGA